MKEEKLTLIFGYQTTEVLSVRESIASLLAEQKIEEENYEIFGDSVLFQSIGKSLVRMRRPYFLIKGKFLEFNLSVVSKGKHDALRITGPSKIQWGDWIEHLRREGRFIHAFVVNREYDHWQNAFDPIQYAARGRDHLGLPMVSNGLPFPLTQDIIDTSKNPGRWILREGYIEALGSPIWFSDEFWKLTKQKKPILDLEGISVRDEGGIMKIDAKGGPFTDATDPVIQERLRENLFTRTID